MTTFFISRISRIRDGIGHRCSVLLLLATVLATFGNSLMGEFVWDDHIYLLNKPAYQSFALKHLVFGLANDLEYLPVRDLSYALDWAIWGQNPFGFHLTNLLLFAAMVLSGYQLASRLQHYLAPESTTPTTARGTALITALLFALHPLHVEVVSFITGRNALLSGLFSLLTFLAFLTSREQPDHRWRHLALALLWFTLALFSKATSLALPLALILLVMLRGGQPLPGLLRTLPFLALAGGAFLLFRTIAARSFVLPYAKDCWTLPCLGEKVALAVQIPFFYLVKLLYPRTLAPEYTIEFPTSLVSAQVMLALAGLVLLIGITWRIRHRHPLIVFGAGWYLLTMIPVLHLFPTYPTVADRYAFLPSYGFCLVGGAAAGQLLARFRSLTPRLALAGIGLLLALLTIRQNLAWRSGESLWRHTLKVSPQSVKAYTNLGRIYFSAGRYTEAFALLAQARDREPTDPHYDFFIGLQHYLRGDYVQALPHFARSEARAGTFLETLFHTGMAHAALGNREQAILYFTRTLQSNQDDQGGFRQQAAQQLQLLQPR